MTDMLTNEQMQLLSERIKELNDDLVTQHINIAGQAFTNSMKLLLALLGIPVGIILLITTLIGKADLSTYIVIPGIAFLVALVLSMAIASRAKKLYVMDDPGLDLSDKIKDYLGKSGLNQEQFQQAARQELSADAPLLEYLDKFANFSKG